MQVHPKSWSRLHGRSLGLRRILPFCSIPPQVVPKRKKCTVVVACLSFLYTPATPYCFPVLSVLRGWTYQRVQGCHKKRFGSCLVCPTCYFALFFCACLGFFARCSLGGGGAARCAFAHGEEELRYRTLREM